MSNISKRTVDYTGSKVITTVTNGKILSRPKTL